MVLLEPVDEPDDVEEADDVEEVEEADESEDELVEESDDFDAAGVLLDEEPRLSLR
ncbi:hypothetical protein ACVW19_002786 [Streptomyces sp. TE5632]